MHDNHQASHLTKEKDNVHKKMKVNIKQKEQKDNQETKSAS